MERIRFNYIDKNKEKKEKISVGKTYCIIIKENEFIQVVPKGTYFPKAIEEQIRNLIIKEFGSIDKAYKYTTENNTMLKYTI
jgi:hypothetical protein